MEKNHYQNYIDQVPHIDPESSHNFFKSCNRIFCQPMLPNNFLNSKKKIFISQTNSLPQIKIMQDKHIGLICTIRETIFRSFQYLMAKICKLH